MTMLFLIRHAQAGVSDHNDPNDTIRPLDAYGRDQANWIADRLASEPIEAFYSSPALRCLQTVQPAADRFGYDVRPEAAFAEGSSTGGALDAVRAVGDRAAVCLHGDLLPEIINTFARAGMELSTDPNFAKGVVWRVVFDDDGRPLQAGCELAPGRATPSEVEG